MTDTPDGRPAPESTAAGTKAGTTAPETSPPGTSEAREPGLEAKPYEAGRLNPPMVPFAIAGMVLWAAVGLALLPFSDQLAESGHTSWLWICLSGFLLGIPGLLVMFRHDAHRRSQDNRQ